MDLHNSEGHNNLSSVFEPESSKFYFTKTSPIKSFFLGRDFIRKFMLRTQDLKFLVAM